MWMIRRRTFLVAAAVAAVLGVVLPSIALAEESEVRHCVWSQTHEKNLCLYEGGTTVCTSTSNC